MRYFIGYLIQGEAAVWHKSLTQTISEKFDTWKIHEHVPPHITLYRPFDVEDISLIKNLLHTWTQQQVVSGTLTLSGFDCFTDRVVFVSVNLEQNVEKAITDVRQKIRTILPKEDFPNWIPHATLADLDVPPEKIVKIFEYVRTLEKPHFVLPFNVITLFRKEGENGWVVDEMFPIVRG